MATAAAEQTGRAEPTEAASARGDSMDMLGGSFDASATVGRFRCGEVACDVHKMEKVLNGTFLDIHSSNESTIHPANGLLMQGLQLLYDNTGLVQSVLCKGDHTIDPYSHMLHCLASKLERDAEMAWQGEKGRKYMFLLNNMYDVLRMMHRPGAAFASIELMSRVISLIQTYKKSYFAVCWDPLNNTLHSNLDEFNVEFLATCDYQRTWKVAAELKYKLRAEIVGLIVPPYEAALKANRSRLSGVLCSLERVIAGKKKQKKYTGEELEKDISALFEG